MRRMNPNASGARLTHGASAPMRQMAQGGLRGGARAQSVTLGALDADALVWREVVAAFTRTPPANGPEPAGKAAARGLLELMARSRPGERHSATASPGRATPSTPIEES